MRVLFTLFPSTAHLYPVIPLAWALQSAGHEVVVATHEGAVEPDLIGNITAAGLTALSLGSKDELPAALRPHSGDVKPDRPTLALDPEDPDENAWRVTRGILGGLFSLYYPVDPGPDGRRPVVDNLVDFARAWRPDLVLWDPLALHGPIAARACGAAHARVLWGADNIALIRSRSRAEAAEAADGPSGDPWVAWLEPLLERYGLEYSEEMLLGRFSLDLTPSRMGRRQDLTYVPVRRVPYNGATALPRWLHTPPERPRAVLTLGMSRRKIFGKYSGFPLREFFDSVADLDLELVATLNGEQLAAVGTVPDNVRTVEYVPLNQLLPSSSAIIHHGGGGTFAAAVAFRVPQLVVPLPMWDEMVTARYVVSRGAGLSIPPDGFDVTTAHRELVRLLEEPVFRDGARALHEDMLAAPAPKDIVPLLERLTAEHRG
ncbi:activator-dependent family glycosyltransferase [Streptomyces sp. NPDC048603]|uniref:activator-dependent family glycosyltransferase n=1 Tax=Streptomyces sp. NPDC048603 TaxID=3365577 RepID=UPI00371C3E07